MLAAVLFAQLRDFIELRKSPLEFEIVDGFIQGIEVGRFDHAGYGVVQFLKSFLSIAVAGLKQGLGGGRARLGPPFRD